MRNVKKSIHTLVLAFVWLGLGGLSAGLGCSDTEVVMVDCSSSPASDLEEYFFLRDMASCRTEFRCGVRRPGSLPCEDQVDRAYDCAKAQPLADAIGDGRLRFDPDAAAKYLKALEKASCDTFGAVSRSERGTVFQGIVALEEPCTMSAECEGDAHCLNIDGICPSRCRPLLKNLETCVFSGSCLSDHCNDYRCESLLPLGANCSEGQCDTMLECLTDDEGTSTCQVPAEFPSRALGEACVHWQRPFCRPELRCAETDQENWVCVEPAQSGASCFHASPKMCPSDEYCKVAASTTEGICSPLPSEGDACVLDLSDEVCAGGLHCVDGICKTLHLNGTPCANSVECASNHCESASAGGVCATVLDCSWSY